MMPVSPIPEQYEKLMPVVSRLYTHMDHLAHLGLLPLFLLAILFAYSADLGLQGAVVSRLKRLVVTFILLAAFPTLTKFIKDLGQDVALSIDDLKGIDTFLKVASQRADGYSKNVFSLLELGNDLIISFLVTSSFLILYFARFLLVAFYHFYWMLLIVTGPLLILGHLFEGTSNLPKNLFKNLILVACWPIIWSILSAFLKALPYVDAYGVEGGYTTIIVMNLIIATSLIFSPFLLSQFCEGMIVGAGSGVFSGAKAVVGMVAPTAGAVFGAIGNRGYTAVKNVMPSKTSIARATSKFSRPIKGIVAVSLLGATSSTHAVVINVRPGLSSVLCFERPPEYVAIGDGKFFKAQKVGPNLLLRSSASDKTTNLLVFEKNALRASHQLRSNLVVPHTESFGCEPKEKPSTPAVLRNSRPLINSVNKGGLVVELAHKAWESPQRDYFSIGVVLKNKSSKTWRPLWSKVGIVQTGTFVPHSGLSAARKELVPGAAVDMNVQFTRMDLMLRRAFLRIPSPQGDLDLLIEKGGKRE